MPEFLKLYLDQMLRLDVAQALRNEGHDVVRASEVGQSRADDQQFKNHLVILSTRRAKWVHTA